MCSSRYCLVAINLIFLVLAFILLIVGSFLQYSMHRDYGVFSVYVSLPVSLIIAFGSLLAFTSCISLLAVYHENRLILSFYSLIVAVLIVGEISVCVAGFVVKPRLLIFMASSMRTAQADYRDDLSANTTWDSLQEDLKCCGVDNYKEWFHYLGNLTLPDSCCAIYTVDCGNNAVEFDNFYKTGCIATISKWTDQHEITVAILFPFIVISQLFSLVCSKRYAIVIRQYESIYY